MSLGLVINALKFLSNPLVLLSVLLAGSLAFGGCQKHRVKVLKQDLAKAEQVRDDFKRKRDEIDKLLTAVRAELALAEREIESGRLEVATLRTELASAQQVRARIEAEHKRAQAASERARKDAERTLAEFVDRYARATRNPDCMAILEAPLCQ